VVTADQAPREARHAPPGFAWRVFSPIGAVVLAFALLIVGAGVLSLFDLSDDSVGAILAFGTGLLLLLFAIGLWRRLPEHERRLAVAPPESLRRTLGLGTGMGVVVIIGAAIILLTGSAIDPVVERRLEEVEEIGTAPWQLVLMVIALVVFAPLGEELLFRGLLLRGLVRRMRFWPAAVLSSALFAAAHADAYLLWPRAVALVATGMVLAWVYRKRGYWASVTTHATVNTIASIALIASS
jgi:membrane protease YdiL (CAAX protease family)